MDNKLTTKAYWEAYYGQNYAKKKHVFNVCSHYDKFWDQFMEGVTPNSDIIEIGGYPGRYLAYLSVKYGVKPTCLDFNSNSTQVELVFEELGVRDYHIINEDFTTFSTDQKYDYVMSNGFVEHFEDFNAILDLHVKYLKTNGKLLVMLPNKRSLRRLYGYACDYKNLKAHNLKSMKLKVLNDFAKRNNLKVCSLQYYGGFPFAVHQPLNIFQKVIFKATRKIFKRLNPFLMKYPSRFYSASIIGIFEKA
ncbi:class I SAM-dependent methyltransferase [Mangrovimonas aestuarii]|uniref:class I SAM-dependent methyltransferase n=1 Tax=Mangrovimonas aestuarii TaxID=3018443 RepID=UPI0023783319|nr:class I SAM-dependent methyltransferase [Mangrovimonas aestuarii]